MTSGVRHTIATYDAALKAVHARAIIRHPQAVWINVGEPTKHICNVCGHGKEREWLAKPNNLLSGSGCPGCRGMLRYTHDEYVALLDQTHGGKISLHPDSTFVSMSKRLAFICNDCGHGSDGQWTKTAQMGIERGCSGCGPGMRVYQLGRREVRVRGYEDYALDWILANTGIKADQIRVDSEREDGQRVVPRIPYRFKGKHCWYYPDFYIPDHEIIVEVKSPSSAGHDRWFTDPAELRRRLKLKERATVQQGYDFRLLVFDDRGQRV